MKDKITIVTHNSKFHADDVFAIATLHLALSDKEISIIRTRDEEWFDKGDYVVDVGSVYDSEKNRFDHHQIESAGERDNGIPYSGFGLVWKKFGEQICGSNETALRIDKRLVQFVDAGDNGVDISKLMFKGIGIYTISDIIGLYVPSWKESNKDIDEEFLKAVAWAQTLLEREIEINHHWIEAEKIIDEYYKKTDDKRLIIFDDNDISFGRITVVSKLLQYPEPLYVVFYGKNSENWQIATIQESENTFKSRKSFPKSWQGLQGKELADITGVSDAVFCHRKGFMCVSESKDGAIKLARLALED